MFDRPMTRTREIPKNMKRHIGESLARDKEEEEWEEIASRWHVNQFTREIKES